MPKLPRLSPHIDSTILLVDDEEGIRNVLSITLKDMGYAVHTAASGEEALEKFPVLQPALVITDIKMPGMGGLELLKRLKSEYPSTEVIMVTGHGDMELAIESLKHDATDFITKPINPDALEIALVRAKEKISTRRELRAHTEQLEELVEEQSALLIEAEKRAAVCEVVRGFASAVKGIAEDFDSSITYFNEMPCFVAIHSPELDIISTNDLYRERLGDLSGSDSWAAYADRSAYGTLCPAARTFSTGKGQRSKETLQSKTGETFPVIVHTAPIRVSSESEEVDLVLEIAADISEMQRLQEELRTTRHRYEQLFNESPCYISVQNHALVIEAANRRYTEAFGDNIGNYCYEVYKQRTLPCTDCPVQRTFADGKTHSAETIVTDKHGEPRYAYIQTAPLYDARGKIVQVIEMSTDITEIRRLQDHLSSLGMLIGSVSHGIKGLLTALDGGMYKVNAGFRKKNDEQVQEGWQLVTHMVNRIKSMVLDILYYAKKRDLDWQQVRVRSFVDELAAAIRTKAEQLGIAFTAKYSPEVSSMTIDPGVVHSALVNILENALEACSDDSTKKHHEVMLEVTQNTEYIMFTVSDNGTGMDQETRERMFTLFFSSKGSQGTGLGLFVSNRIIEQHGGTITVDSIPEAGTTFHIRLPCNPQTLSDNPQTQ